MATFCVGTMRSSHGWETQSPEVAASMHLLYWFESRASQGRILGDVPSFYKLHQQYGSDKNQLMDAMSSELESYFKELFDVVHVQVTARDKDNSISLYTLQMAIKFNVDGVTYDLAKAVSVNGDQFTLLDESRNT